MLLIGTFNLKITSRIIAIKLINIIQRSGGFFLLFLAHCLKNCRGFLFFFYIVSETFLFLRIYLYCRFHIKYFYFKFDVEYFLFWFWCWGFIFQRFLHDVRLKALSLVSLWNWFLKHMIKRLIYEMYSFLYQNCVLSINSES